MPEDFVVARNTEESSALPYLLRIPLGPRGVVLKAREPWPRTSKVYCHRAQEWPAEPEVVERVPVRTCVRRGPAIDLVLDRARENRSQFVMTRIRGGREAIFWQSPRTAKQARPNVALPTGRAQGTAELEVVVDARERYPYRFAHQAVRTSRRTLSAGDYAVELDGEFVAVVERKSLGDLASSLVSGRLRYAMADLAAVERAAVVVEDRYSRLLTVEHVRPALVLDGLAEEQVRHPGVPIVFCETRPLAEEWTYRFLAAAQAQLQLERAGDLLELPEATELGPPPPTTAEVRAWALAAGWSVSDRGTLRPEVWAAHEAATRTAGD